MRHCGAVVNVAAADRRKRVCRVVQLDLSARSLHLKTLSFVSGPSVSGPLVVQKMDSDDELFDDPEYFGSEDESESDEEGPEGPEEQGEGVGEHDGKVAFKSSKHNLWYRFMQCFSIFNTITFLLRSSYGCRCISCSFFGFPFGDVA